jgi:hypothetical protein
MGFPYSNGPVEDDRFTGAQPAQGGQVPDLSGGDLRVRGEVEPFQGDLFLEAGAADPAGQRGGLPAADLVLAQDLQELQVPEGAGPGLRSRASRVSSIPVSFNVRSASRSDGSRMVMNTFPCL